jgi:hypothetical protein
MTKEQTASHQALFSDRSFLLAAVRLNGISLWRAAPALQADPDLVLVAVSRVSEGVRLGREEVR